MIDFTCEFHWLMAFWSYDLFTRASYDIDMQKNMRLQIENRIKISSLKTICDVWVKFSEWIDGQSHFFSILFIYFLVSIQSFVYFIVLRYKKNWRKTDLFQFVICYWMHLSLAANKTVKENYVESGMKTKQKKSIENSLYDLQCIRTV